MSKIFRGFGAAALAAVCVMSASASAGTVSFSQVLNSDLSGYVDVHVNPSPNSEFTNFDLIATPSVGQILDPVRNQAGNAGNYDVVGDGARLDTWANTPFSALGAGTPSYVFTSYNPGSPPFTPPQELPSAGGAVASLNWSVFDTATGDSADFGPYHLARVMFSPGGQGEISILSFDTITSGTGGEAFSFAYGIPEPGSLLLAGFGAVACVALRRKK
jgi:hypothetical protein